MKIEGRRRSSNIDDRRGGRRKKAGLGIGGLVIVGLIALALGADLGDVLGLVADNAGSTGGGTAVTGAAPSPEQQALADLVSVVLADTEDTWNPLFTAAGRTYREPTLVLFSDEVQSACGTNSAAVGPFYCPGDQQVYIDLSFFADLDSRFGAPGDFAQAYVVAHEVGHHVQTLLGTSQRVRQQKQGLSEEGQNALSVRLELQADCYAGVWGHHAHTQRDLLDQGDLEEALRAAAAIGDDTLQRRAGGRVSPETFTHGSAAERAQWFRTGFAAGTIASCDTFGAGG